MFCPRPEVAVVSCHSRVTRSGGSENIYRQGGLLVLPRTFPSSPSCSHKYGAKSDPYASFLNLKAKVGPEKEWTCITALYHPTYGYRGPRVPFTLYISFHLYSGYPFACLCSQFLPGGEGRELCAI
jgi:hypothetical protein